MVKFLELYIKDPNIIWLVKKFLKAGVIDEVELLATDEGSAQGLLCGAPHKEPYAEINVMRSQSRKCA
jgi:hypothetical protein